MINLVPLKRRQNLCGVGILDADYQVYKNGAQCPYYSIWSGILSRCYNTKIHAKQPTYIGCTVAPEWIRFSKFKAWMESQKWEGMDLDKDILVPGNKVYGPKFCRFVSHELNSFVANLKRSSRKRTDLPVGVTLHNKKYGVKTMIGGKMVYLGAFDTLLDASRLYLEAKMSELERLVSLQDDVEIVHGLMRHAEILLLEHQNCVNKHNALLLSKVG